jgi:hypothetical protein
MTLREELEQPEFDYVFATLPNPMIYNNHISMLVTMTNCQSVLNIHNGTIVIQSVNKMPNPVWRFFQWALLGFKWSKP